MTDTEIQMQEVSPRARRSKLSSGSSIIGGGSIEYTSLRDVLVDGGSGLGGGSCGESGYDIHDFDPSNISIRNRLLKHAASAYYLQSAVVVASRHQSCLSRLWRRMQFHGRCCRVLMRACLWQGCANDPVALCVTFVAQSARRLGVYLIEHVTCIWAQYL